MKTGKSIVELAALITAQQEQKKDFVTPTTALEYIPEAPGGKFGGIRFKAGDSEYVAAPNRHCLGQIADHTGVPARYVERMAETEKGRVLLATNFGHWFREEPSKRMLRTFINGTATARAFLSNRYRPLDNSSLAEAVLPKLLDSGCEILSSEITEKRLYIQAATPKIEIDIPALMKERGIKGLHDGKRPEDPVRAGIVISNSEVGAGSIRVEPMIYRLRCYNGLILAEAIRRNHVGRNNSFAELEEAAEFFTDATRELDDKAFFAKVRDVVNGVLNADGFANLVEKFARAQSVELADAQGAVEIVTKKFRTNEDESKSILNHLVRGGDLSLFGLVNAVTRTAEDVESYDRAIEFERMGGEVLELPTQIWSAN